MSWEWWRVVRGAAIDGIFRMQSVADYRRGPSHVEADPRRRRDHHGRDLDGVPGPRRLEYQSDPRWSAAGFYAGLPSIALIAIRQDPDYHFHAILYLFFVVWSADTGAFFPDV